MSCVLIKKSHLYIFQIWPPFDLQWPMVTCDFWGQNAIAYVVQWYNMSMHAKNGVPECILKIWPPYDLQWPLVTSYDFWGQNIIAYVGLGYHMIMHAENEVSGWTFQFWPHVDL